MDRSTNTRMRKTQNRGEMDEAMSHRCPAPYFIKSAVCPRVRLVLAILSSLTQRNIVTAVRRGLVDRFQRVVRGLTKLHPRTSTAALTVKVNVCLVNTTGA